MTADGVMKWQTVHGHCDPRFSRVREVFDAHFADGTELGAAFAVYLDGELVVDLWDGVADRRTGRPWEQRHPRIRLLVHQGDHRDRAALQLAERGLVDVTAPVAEVWPEFAVRGKQRVTVEHLLSHQAGLPALDEQVPVEEFEDQPAIAARLAGQRPIWEPGTAHGYHALTYGFLVGEVVRRVTGKSVGELVAAEISGPLGLDLWVGAPDDVIERAARLTAGARARQRRIRTGGARARTGHGTAGETRPERAGRPEAPAGAAGRGPETPIAAIARAARDPNSLMNRAMGNPPIQASGRGQQPGHPACRLARRGPRHHRPRPGGVLPRAAPGDPAPGDAGGRPQAGDGPTRSCCWRARSGSATCGRP